MFYKCSRKKKYMIHNIIYLILYILIEVNMVHVCFMSVVVTVWGSVGMFVV